MPITNPRITLSSQSASDPSHQNLYDKNNGQVIASPLPLASSRYDLSTYEPIQIHKLKVGPANVTFKGRVVNLIHRAWLATAAASEESRAAGYLKLVVSDGTGVVVVKLFYTSTPPKDLNLGSLILTHATHISPQDPNIAPLKHEGLFISIFPERDHTVALCILHESVEENASLCRIPLGYRPGRRCVSGMKPLMEIMAGGGKPTEGEIFRIMVVVKSLGPTRKISISKDNVERTAYMAEIVVRDRTTEAILSLWDYCISGARLWKVGETVLLISNPAIKGIEGRQKLVLSPATTLEIDPALSMSQELRAWADSKVRDESVHLPFPHGVFDTEAFDRSAQKLKFTLSDMNQFVRAEEKETYMGYFSLVIFESQLTKLHAEEKLCSGECCGTPVFSNNIEQSCHSCGNIVELRANPGIIKTLSDETGSIAGSKMIWSPSVVKRLLGRCAHYFVKESYDNVREIECAILYYRATLLVGWSPNVGRLVVLEFYA